MSFKKQIGQLIQGEILDDERSLDFYSKDASLFQVKPALVVIPKGVEDISKLVNLVNLEKENQTGLSLTVRSAGTDMTGGPLSESIVLDLNKSLNKIIKIEDGEAITEPGVYYLEFEKKAKEKGLLLPCYPASKAICSVGGMVANNAGGEKTLIFGNTEKFVKKLKVILRDGQEYTFEALTKHQLDKKLKQEDVEGGIYRDIYNLIKENRQLIQNSQPKVSKNSSGYYLWDVWVGETFDLTRLLVGSQGTLGIITEITFRLIKPKPFSKLLVIELDDFDQLGDLVNQVLLLKPESFECYDDQTLKYAIRYFPEIVEYLKRVNKLHLVKKDLPIIEATLTQNHPKLTLLAEFTGDSEAEVLKKAETANKMLPAFNVRSKICKTAEEAGEYWAIRRESYNLLRHHAKDKSAAPFIEDIIVKPSDLPEFLPELNKIMSKYDLTFTLAGHIGDAHFHIIPLMDLKDQKTTDIFLGLSDEVFDLVIKYHGSIAGEHNDGLVRSPYVKKMFGEEVYRLFEKVKTIFDPDNIFNPGKKVDSSLDYTLAHIKDK